MTTLSDESHPHRPISRRNFLWGAGSTGVLMAATPYLRAASASADPSSGSTDVLEDDEVAQAYYRVLLRHTRWAETKWDAAGGHYAAADFSFAVVLGNAVLLTRGHYDPDAAGIDATTLRAHTVATIAHFAASNRLAGGTEWGQTLFWDSTFELYFQLAGRLLWADLDGATRANLDTIAQRQAEYSYSLGVEDDPRSGSWTPNGLSGGWIGDTKLEEMGVYAQSLAPGIAWAPAAAGADDWLRDFGRWSRNETGLPPADLANPTVVDGVAVSDNTAHNLYDTFIVENHGSFEPHYQCELWRTSGRNSIHFITAGTPMPEVFAAQPNGERLWRSVRMVMSDAGEPLMPMIADREHLYGRDVIPIAFLAQVLGDRSAAWAESAMAARLEAYQAYPPQYRITKFSGEPKYEPEARGEVAISYLLHDWRARRGEPVRPVQDREFFAAASGVSDFGTGPGLVAHQSEAAWAGTVSKAGFVKFAWQPAHDDWLLRISGATPMFLPRTNGTVHARHVTTYTRLRDGIDASASVLTLDEGVAGFATLPGGSVVYATTGTGAGEGHLEVHNLTMPGVAGLDGDRTYTAAEGAVTVASPDSASHVATPAGVSRVDTVSFAATSARWVRMLGVEPDPEYGYSIFELQVRDGAGGSDLALGAVASASSADTGKAAALAIDGDMSTRWAVSRGDRSRADSWLAIDLGQVRAFDEVDVFWEAAAGRRYLIQASDDGQTWTTVASHPTPDLVSNGGWLEVDGRAGLIVRGSSNPITVVGDTITLSDGPAGPLLVEAVPGSRGMDLQAAAAGPAPTASPSTVRASTVEGCLSVFNLAGTATRATVSVPASGSKVLLYQGVQVRTVDGTDCTVELAAASAVVLAARFEISPVGSRALPIGLRAEVLDATRLRLSGPACRVRVRSMHRRGGKVVLVRPRPRTLVLPGIPAYPLTDLALGCVTFPTSPLPAGMSDPAAAVDGRADTSWCPGVGGRMVVDLGRQCGLGLLRLDWVGDGRECAVEVAVSTDGADYTGVGRIGSSHSSLSLSSTARYVALTVSGWQRGGPALRQVEIEPAEAGS